MKKRLLSLLLMCVLILGCLPVSVRAGTAISFTPDDLIGTTWTGSYTGGTTADGVVTAVIQRQSVFTIDWCSDDGTVLSHTNRKNSTVGAFGGTFSNDTPVTYEFEGTIDFATGEFRFVGTRVLSNSTGMNVFFTEFRGTMTGDYLTGESTNEIGTFPIYFRKAGTGTAGPTDVAAYIPDAAGTFGGHSYYAYTTKETWARAEDYCESVGGHLVAINSREEQEFLECYLDLGGFPEGAYFIGLHRAVDQLNTWITGEPVSYTNWGEGEPDNAYGGQETGVIWKEHASSGPGYSIERFQWDDDRDDYRCFICEWDTAAEKPPLGKTIDLELKYDSWSIPCVFSEDYFSRSAYSYNHDLAFLTLALEVSSYSANETGIWGEDGADNSSTARRRYANIADAYRQMGFDTAEYYNYGVTLNASADKAAYSIGTKALADGSTLVTAVVRGSGYGAEWASNFHLTASAMRSGYHEGFYAAADKVYQTLTRKIAGISGPVKVWITGYSRGAATANILAGRLDDYAAGVSNLSPERIYAYTFATPCGVLPEKNPSAAKYANIFNIVNPGDIVPMVAPGAWGYTRYGTTLTFDADAGYSLTSAVNSAHTTLLLTSSDPQVRDLAGKDSFSAGKNARYGATHQDVMDVLMDLYPTESSARGFLDAVSDLLRVVFCRTADGNGWRKLTFDEAIAVLQDEYGAASISAAVERVKKNLPPTNVLLADLANVISMKAADLVILIGAIADYHDVSVTDLMGMLWDVVDAVKEDDTRWSKTILASISGAVDPYKEGVKTFFAMVETGHTPLTYLAWMRNSPEEIFARHASYGSGSGSSGLGSSGGGGRDAFPSGWAAAEVAAAEEAGLVPSALQGGYQNAISREEVSDMFVNLIEEAIGKPISELMAAKGVTVNENAFSDTQNASVLAMSALGIINGVGDGKFSPASTLTRAQIAAIVNRVARLLGENTEGYSHSFTDVAGSWVDSELGWPAAVGIINGVGGGRFDPNGQLTDEQAILIVYRALHALTGD